MPDLHSTSYPLSIVQSIVDPDMPRDHTLYHVSNVINELARVLGYRKYVYGEYESADEAGKNMMALGRIWEQVVRSHVIQVAQEEGLKFMPQRILERDGIVGSTDGLLYQSDSPDAPVALVETKLRFGPPSDPRDHWRYMAQVKAYCQLAGVTRAWMPILYLETRPPNGRHMLHRLEFSQLEIKENWQSLVKMTDYLEAKHDNDTTTN